MEGGRWEHFPHGADIGVRGLGRTREEAFAQAAIALTAVVTDPEGVMPLRAREVSCDAATLDDLFFDFIDEIVFAMSAEGMLFARAEVRIEGSHLDARLIGELVDRERHELAVEVKGPTYTELRVTHDLAREQWCAQCVVDV